MEKEIVMAENGNLDFHDDDGLSTVQINGVHKENENSDVDFLEDLDSYWEDINDRLTISRVVNDSIIRGMVTAVESEAAEKIAQKDLELSRIKETLLLYHVGSEENEFPLMHDKAFLDTSDGLTQGSLSSLKKLAKKQLLMLVQELTNLREYIQINGSSSTVDDTLGLGCNPHDTRSKTVDKMLDSLKSILETVLKRKNDMELPSLWQEYDCQKQIESAVVASFVRSLKDEYEQRLSDQNAEFGGHRSLLLGNVKEITGLRQELEAIRKSFLDHENGDIEAGEEGDRKRVEKLHRKMSGSLNSASSVWDNGKHEECSVGLIPENYEVLKHLSHDELITHFKTVMSKMSRDHEYEIQEMTEKCFTFKRKYLNLKERGSFSFVGKDKELEMLKKKIPYVISKLDMILMEDEKLVSEGKNDADFKHQLDSLLLENRQLKHSLSDAAEKISKLSHAEADHQKLVRKLESDIEDSCVEASIYEDVYGCFVMKFVDQIKCAGRETTLEHSIIREAYELILGDRASKEGLDSKDEIEDSCVESFIMDQCCAVVFKEALKEAHNNIMELVVHVKETEETLRSEIADKERLKEEIHRLRSLVKEKEDLVQIAESNMDTLRHKLELGSQQINDMQSQIEEQQIEIENRIEALRVVSACELEKIEGYEAKISNLGELLKFTRERLKVTIDEKRKTEENLSASKAKIETLRKQLGSLDLVIAPELMKGFNILEGLLAEKTKNTNSRLKNMQVHLRDLSHEINEVKGKASMYKQRLEKKCCDLQKAEAEVDLLGDEVETHLDILEKIYIALDHYSPVLKHYPGIIEILKLVRRELSGESKRPLD